MGRHGDEHYEEQLRAAFIRPLDDDLAHRHLGRMRSAHVQAAPGSSRMRWLTVKVLAAAVVSTAGIAAASVGVVKVAERALQPQEVPLLLGPASSESDAPKSKPGDAVTGTARQEGKGASKFQLNGTVTASGSGALSIAVTSASHSLEACGIKPGDTARVGLTSATRISPPKSDDQNLVGAKVHAGGTISGCTLTATKLNVSQGSLGSPKPSKSPHPSPKAKVAPQPTSKPDGVGVPKDKPRPEPRPKQGRGPADEGKVDADEHGAPSS